MLNLCIKMHHEPKHVQCVKADGTFVTMLQKHHSTVCTRKEPCGMMCGMMICSALICVVRITQRPYRWHHNGLQELLTNAFGLGPNICKRTGEECGKHKAAVITRQIMAQMCGRCCARNPASQFQFYFSVFSALSLPNVDLLSQTIGHPTVCGVGEAICCL